MIFRIIAKIHDFADKLEDAGRDDLVETLDKIASFLIESYKFRVKRQRKSRGITRTRRRQRYRRNRAKTKRKQKLYRRRTRVQRKRRRRMRHYKRVG